MQIRIRETGAVVFDNEFRSMHPNTGFPAQLTEEIINEFGGDVVFEGPQATGGDRYQYSVYGGVEQVNGKWYTKWNLGPSFFDTEDEEGNVTTAAQNEAAYKAAKDAEQAKAVRQQRDSKLAESDWRMIKAWETQTTISQEWATYRQALRDVTSQSGFPWEVTWPDAP